MTFDPTRLVLEAPEGGERLAERLRVQNIEVEMYDPWRVVIILTCMDTEEEIRHLADVLTSLPGETADLPTLQQALPMPRQVMTPRKAVMSETENVSLSQAAGRVSAVSAGLYPPGIPSVCPGEEITEETAKQLKQASSQRRFGVEGDTILCVK